MKASVSVLLFLSLFGLNVSGRRTHTYMAQKKNWENAQKFCRENYDDLSTVNAEEAQMLSKMAKGDVYLWIGLHISPTNPKKWIWSGGEDEKFVSWDVGEPSMNKEACGLVNSVNSGLISRKCSLSYPFSCMRLFQPILLIQRKTWNEALKLCRRLYVDMVNIRSQARMAEVINIARVSETAYVWIGLRFVAGQWIWVSGHDLTTYQAWSSVGETECPAKNLRCGALDKVKNVWFPKDCEEKLNVVCLMK